MISVIDRNLLKKVCIAVTTFMLLAHMYVFTNGALLFDVLGVYRGDIDFSVVSDKWAGGLYWWIDLGVNCPWLAGVWSTVLMIATVYCICDILEIYTTWGITLTAGLCAINSTIICEQEYTGQNFYIIIPLFQAVLAAWIMRKSHLHAIVRVVLSVSLIALSAGTYGAMVSAMPAILLVAVIFDILKGNSSRENWINSFKYIVVFLCGMALYYIILRTLLHVQGGEIQSYMGEDAISNVGVLWSMIKIVPEAYKNIISYYLGHSFFLPKLLNRALSVFMLLGIVESVALLMVERKNLRDKLYNGILLLFAVGISPAVLNLIYIMSLGHVHYLMIFTYSIPPIAFIKVNELLLEKMKKPNSRYVGYISRALSVFFIYYSIVMSNAMYISYQQMYIETISIGTRILDRIESCDGFDGTEEVVLLGAIYYNDYWGTPDGNDASILNASLGPGNPSNVNGVNWTPWLVRFCVNVLDSNLSYSWYGNAEDCIQKEAITSDGINMIMEMTAFPSDGSIKKIGNKIYVRLSDNE